MSENAPHYGPMTEQRARELIEHLGYPFDSGGKAHDADGQGVVLDGRYTADELEALAWWMRNKA